MSTPISGKHHTDFYSSEELAEKNASALRRVGATRLVHYSRKPTTTFGKVRLEEPKLKGISLESEHRRVLPFFREFYRKFPLKNRGNTRERYRGCLRRSTRRKTRKS